jgi:glutathione S-transferase/translation elongation factor EF-1beta
MKLHFSNDGITNSRYRKIKAVINALKVEVEEVKHDAHTDLSGLSPFNTLPLLETKEGTFFSSNTIIRYLAASSDKLYGNNLYQRGLVDQWLDITTCDFEAAVAAVAIAKEGRDVDGSRIVADINKFLGFVENHLNGKKFLVGDSATIADFSVATSIAVILTSLGDEDRKPYQNVISWYTALVESDNTIGSKDFPKESHKPFKVKKDKKAEKKVEKKTEKPAEDDFDPFADDGEAAPKAAAPKPKVEAKPKKPKPVAKSIVVFDVKVYEEEFDLDALWEKIQKEVVIEGLVWNPNPKKIPVVGKVFKLQIGCVVEDDKVATDDIFDKITAWEDDVQSIDIVSFQKL